MTAAVDHLVVAARTLEEGVDWCEATLGVRPEAGGKHALMGTHNRVFAIASPRFPRAYLELMAIDPDARPPARARWFDLDQPALQAALAGSPQLIHWVMRCGDIESRSGRLRAAGIDRGEILDVERDTAHGLLRWRISVRRDGARLYDGALPTLIQWGEHHPSDHMAPSGVSLESLELCGLPAAGRDACVAAGVTMVADGPALCARLSTPRGSVVLRAPALGDRDVRP